MTFNDYINRYTTVTSSHEAAFDEYLAETDYRPATGPLKLETKVEAFLKRRFQEFELPSVVLTGNAGDGKTYLCRRLIEEFTGKTFEGWPSEGIFDSRARKLKAPHCERSKRALGGRRCEGYGKACGG